jgi:hypothetical protein
MMSGAAVRQLAVFRLRPVSRFRYTQLGVLRAHWNTSFAIHPTRASGEARVRGRASTPC